MSPKRISTSLFVTIFLCSLLPFYSYQCGSPDKYRIPYNDDRKINGKAGGEITSPAEWEALQKEKQAAQQEGLPIGKVKPKKEAEDNWMTWTGFQYVVLVGGETVTLGYKKKEALEAFFANLAVIPFLLALYGLILSLKKRYDARRISIVSGIGAILLLFWRISLDPDEQRAEIGYYIILTLFIAVTIFNACCYKCEDKIDDENLDEQP
ncbi:hypothetical protein ACFL2A_06535, partial [Thermodesulfobacteriota bacterium]